MSVVSLQFGQCGNQIGQNLYSTIFEDLKLSSDTKISNKKFDSYYNHAVNKWFSVTESGKYEPRSILIDTESKVVDASANTSFNFKNVVAKSVGGSANNWSFGYSERGTLLRYEVLDAVRSEVEKTDLLTHFLNILSSSGGTGSGVGSRLAEVLRDEYPNKTIINAVVLPYSSGEVVTQSYNTVLTLAKLYSVSDGTLLFQNDELHYICRNSVDIKNITLSCLNDIIAEQLSAVYQPLENKPTNQLFLDLIAHPAYKLMHIKSAPHVLKKNMHFESSRNWKSLVESISKQSRFEYSIQAKAGIKMKPKCVSSVVITTGMEQPTSFDTKSLIDGGNHVAWLPKREGVKHFHVSRMFQQLDKYLTVVSNSNNVFLPLDLIVQDAWKLFTYGAYLHHYEKYGVDKNYFLQTFQTLEDILHSYKTL